MSVCSRPHARRRAAKAPSSVVGHRKVEIAKILDANVAGGRHMPWETRLALIKEYFPSVDTLDWQKIFTGNVEVMAWIVRDILRVNFAEPGRDGPRPMVSYEVGYEALKPYLEDEYSYLDFPIALKALAGERSWRSLSTKTGLDRNQVGRLLRGESTPSFVEMETIARAFKKPPSWFFDYRVAIIMAVFLKAMESNPEVTANWYRLLKDKNVRV